MEDCEIDSIHSNASTLIREMPTEKVFQLLCSKGVLTYDIDGSILEMSLSQANEAILEFLIEKAIFVKAFQKHAPSLFKILLITLCEVGRCDLTELLTLGTPYKHILHLP